MEHILLRPLTQDAVNKLPLLQSAARADPFSLQLSFVCPEWLQCLEERLTRVMREETPAHIVAHLVWLKEPTFRILVEAHDDWLGALRRYWHVDRLGVLPDAPDPRQEEPATSSAGSVASLRARITRNRLIDLLNLGETYPVRDIPVSDRLIVPYGMTAAIAIEYSEKGVAYSLFAGDKKVNGSDGVGTGTTLTLTTPVITSDVTYKVQAEKPTGRRAFLISAVTIKVGIDIKRKAILLPADGIVGYGETVTVVIPEEVNPA